MPDVSTFLTRVRRPATVALFLVFSHKHFGGQEYGRHIDEPGFRRQLQRFRGAGTTVLDYGTLSVTRIRGNGITFGTPTSHGLYGRTNSRQRNAQPAKSRIVLRRAQQPRRAGGCGPNRSRNYG